MSPPQRVYREKHEGKLHHQGANVFSNASIPNSTIDTVLLAAKGVSMEYFVYSRHFD